MPINLSEIKPELLRDKVVFQEDILKWLENENAYWRYQGEPSPEKPHAELSSGLCSNGFFDCQRVLCYPNIAEIIGFQLAWEIKVCMREERIRRIDFVASPAYAAMTLGHEVAKALGAKFLFTEKDASGQKGKEKMLFQRMTIPEDSVVLPVDELVTTTGTIKKVKTAIEEGNPDPVVFTPFAGTMVHRPASLKEKTEYDIVSLIRQEIQNFEQSDCPYCAAGSPRLRPKKNWAELTKSRNL